MVSVLIPNLHSPYLGAVLAALRQQTVLPTEMLVVGMDRHGLAQDDDLVRVFPLPRPTPPALALNAALAYARGSVCVFLDADCVPAADWLERLLEPFARGYAVVGGSLGFQPQSYWQRCDNIASWSDLLVTAPPGERLCLSSGNLAVFRAALRRVGGHAEHFRMAGGEDTELTLRLRAAGFPGCFTPRAVVFNHSDKTTARQVFQHLFRHGSQWHAATHRFGALLPASRWHRCAARWPALAAALVPLVVLRDLLRTYGAQPRLLRAHWSAIFGVAWARAGWYGGRLYTLLRQRQQRISSGS
jgi:GT2 family glycosyltransferase